jgi:hypothetical protein
VNGVHRLHPTHGDRAVIREGLSKTFLPYRDLPSDKTVKLKELGANVNGDIVAFVFGGEFESLIKDADVIKGGDGDGAFVTS